MTCLYLDKRGLTLKSEGNVLVIMGEGDSGKLQRISTIPLNLITRICIKSSTQLSATLLAKLGEKDIAVLVLQGLQRKPVMMLPSYRQDALRRQVQLQLSLQTGFCVQFSRRIVARKLNAQLTHLEELMSDLRDKTPLLALQETWRNMQETLKGIDNISSLLGVEGSASNLYFKGISDYVPKSLGFQRRNKRPPKDPFNVVLSLGYTLLHYEWVRQIYLMGLDPYIGFYHQPHFGRESLASDLMEPLRPQYDAFALSLFKDQVLRAEDFSFKAEACQMRKAGRLRFYEAFELFLQKVGPLIRAEKQLLFATMQTEEHQWKSALRLENSFGVFDQNSLQEQRI